MPVDANIALGVRPPGQVEGPLDTYAKTIQLKDMMDQGRLRGLQEREGEQNLEIGAENLRGQKTRNQLEMKKMADEEAAGEIIKKYLVKTDEDGTYSFDHDAVEGAMARAGLNPLSYREKRLDIEKKADDAIKAHLETNITKSKKLGQVAAAVLNAPEDLRPGVYNFSLKQAMAQGLVTPEQLKDPAMQQYVPGKTDQYLQQLADMALDNPFEAMLKRQQMKTDQLRQAEQAAKTLAEQTAVESQLLGVAKTPAEWANALAQLPEDRRKMYPAEWSESARQAAANQGVSPDTRAQLERFTSVVELAHAAAGGDRQAAAALRELEQREIRVESAKEAARLGGGGYMPTGGAAIVGVPEGQLNEAVLAGVNPGMASIVRQLVDGKIPFPSSFALRTPYWNKVLELAAQYEPGFSATLYKQRADTIKDFTSGQAARNVTALNTVTGHLDTLSKAAAALDNSKFTLYNTVANWAASATGDPRIKKFELARNAVADELERVFRGTGGSLEGIRAWKDTIDSAGSPEQLDAAVKQAIELMGSRIEALRDQYQKGMARQESFAFLTPKSREILKKLGTDVDAIDPPSADAGPSPTGERVYAVMPDNRRIYTTDGANWFYEDTDEVVR